jgi:hypothetical protein
MDIRGGGGGGGGAGGKKIGEILSILGQICYMEEKYKHCSAELENFKRSGLWTLSSFVEFFTKLNNWNKCCTFRPQELHTRSDKWDNLFITIAIEAQINASIVARCPSRFGVWDGFSVEIRLDLPVPNLIKDEHLQIWQLFEAIIITIIIIKVYLNSLAVTKKLNYY